MATDRADRYAAFSTSITSGLPSAASAASISSRRDRRRGSSRLRRRVCSHPSRRARFPVVIRRERIARYMVSFAATIGGSMGTRCPRAGAAGRGMVSRSCTLAASIATSAPCTGGENGSFSFAARRAGDEGRAGGAESMKPVEDLLWGAGDDASGPGGEMAACRGVDSERAARREREESRFPAWGPHGGESARRRADSLRVGDDTPRALPREGKHYGVRQELWRQPPAPENPIAPFPAPWNELIIVRSNWNMHAPSLAQKSPKRSSSPGRSWRRGREGSLHPFVRYV